MCKVIKVIIVCKAIKVIKAIIVCKVIKPRKPRKVCKGGKLLKLGAVPRPKGKPYPGALPQGHIEIFSTNLTVPYTAQTHPTPQKFPHLTKSPQRAIIDTQLQKQPHVNVYHP